MRSSVNILARSGYRVARKGAVVRIVSAVFGLWVLASILVHPLPHELSDRSGAPLLPGAEIAPSVANVFNHACIDCHSEKTRWPWYSNLAPASWVVEGDVKRARGRLNLSRWDSVNTAEQRALLTAIATVIENHEMPPHRYVMLHPQGKLSADDSAGVIEWTRAERRRLRVSVGVVNKNEAGEDSLSGNIRVPRKVQHMSTHSEGE
jgi:Haem-binding domain